MITNEEETKIKKLYLQNNTYNEISKALNVSKKDIMNYIKKSELQIKRKERNIQIIRKGLEENKSREDIAQLLGVEPNKVSNLAAYFKIPTNFKEIRHNKQEITILDEYKEEPRSIQKMAFETGISYSFCKKIYKKYNLKSIVVRNTEYRKLSKEETDQIIKEIKEENKTLAQIGRNHNVSRQWIAHLKKTKL